MVNSIPNITASILFVVFLMCVSTLAQENIPYDPESCVDCHGKSVSPREYYYDGCNVCYCYDGITSVCTDKWCDWNKCYPTENEEEKEKENEKEEKEEKETNGRKRYPSSRRSNLWWK